MSEVNDQWVVSLHTLGGSMGEAVGSLATLGPYTKEVAHAIEKAVLDRQKAKGGYVEENLWAIAEPLSFPGTNPDSVADWCVTGDGPLADYFED